MKSRSDALLASFSLSNVAAVACGESWSAGTGGELIGRSPIDGRELARFASASKADAERAIHSAGQAFSAWRGVPAPKRGELVRRIGERLREVKPDLAALVTLETGKILAEALGEVQE